MTTAWDRRPRLVEDVLGKDGEVRKAGWLDEARLPKWSAKEVRDKCWTLLLRDKEMTQTAFLKECGGGECRSVRQVPEGSQQAERGLLRRVGVLRRARERDPGAVVGV